MIESGESCSVDFCEDDKEKNFFSLRRGEMPKIPIEALLFFDEVSPLC